MLEKGLSPSEKMENGGEMRIDSREQLDASAEITFSDRLKFRRWTSISRKISLKFSQPGKAVY